MKAWHLIYFLISKNVSYFLGCYFYFSKKKKKSLIDLQEFFSFEMLLFQQKTVKSKISKNH